MSTGKTYSTKYLLDSNNNRGSEGQILSTTSTGIDWVDANTVPGTGLWVTSGNNIYNSNSGNVGIGTTSPDYKLDVSGDFRVKDGSSAIALNEYSNGATIWLDGSNGDFAGGDYFNISAYGTTDLAFGYAAGTKITMKSDGKLGIGTTAPGEKLVIAGGVLAYGDTSSIGSGTSYYLGNNPNSRDIVFTRVANAELGIGRYNGGWYETMRFDADGNVGIGTTSPSSRLTVQAAGSQTTQRAITIFHNNTLAEGYASIGAQYTATNGYIDSEIRFGSETLNGACSFMSFATGCNNTITEGSNSERMRITSGGNVGIGETSPDFRLDVSKGYISGNGKVAKFRSGNDATFVNFDTVQVVQQDVPCLAIIETSTGTQTDEQKLTFAVGDNKAIIGTTSTVTNGMSFYTNRAVTTTGFTAQGNLALHLANTGNVGIGTTSPNVPLEVHGADITTRANTTAQSVLRLVRDVTDSNYTSTKDSAVDFMLSRQQTVNNNLPYTRLDIRLAGTTDSSTPSLDVMSLLHNGNVGIGTTSPSQKLTVVGNTYISNGLLLLDNNQDIRWGDAGERITGNNTNGLVFTTNNLEAMRINSAGNVGIGTTSPVTNLQIASTGTPTLPNASGTALSTGSRLRLSSVGGPSATLDIGIGTGGKSWLQSRDVTDLSLNYPFLLNPNGGNVGIGTTSPDAELHVNDTTGNSIIRFSGGATSNETYDIGQGIAAVSNGGFGFRNIAENKYVMVFQDSTGNVGIGTTSPSTKLEVTGHVTINSPAGASQTSYGLRLRKTNSSSAVQAGGEILASVYPPNTNAANLIFKTANASANLTQRMVIDGIGNVGIGTTSPDSKLHVAGGTRLGGGGCYISTDASFSTNFSYTFRDAVGINNPNSVSAPSVAGYVMSVGRSISGGVGGGIYVEGESRFARGLAGVIKFNAYDGTNNTGSPTHILGTDASGNVVKSTAGSSIGPWLPLAGGTMTGVTQFNDHTNYGDQVYARFGASQDLQIFHNGTDSFIDNYTGSLTIRNRQDDGHIVFTCDDGSGGLASYLTLNGNNTHAYFTNPGNVGIGTTSPGVKLEVVGSYGNVIKAVSGSQNITTNFVAPSTGSGLNNIISTGGDFNIGTSDAKSFDLTTNSVSRVAILSDGKVGIGTTSPSQKLEVAGSVAVTGTNVTVANASNPYIYINDTNAGAGIFQQEGNTTRIGSDSNTQVVLVQNNATAVTIDTSKNVGIGTTSPDYKLEVNGTLGVNRTDGIIFAGSAAAGYGNKITADTSNDFIFSTSLPSAPYTVSEKMRIANNGAATFTSTVTATNFILSSDERLKENIEKVCDNRVKADWKTFELKTEKGQKRYGVIAQELEKTNPEFVREDSQGFKSVAYIDLLIAKIAELEARLEKLEK